jgi:hypothetical protein
VGTGGRSGYKGTWDGVPLMVGPVCLADCSNYVLVIPKYANFQSWSYSCFCSFLSHLLLGLD